MSWLVAQTHGACEGKALFHLRRVGFEAFTPRYSRTDRKNEITEGAVLFPSYVFVNVDLDRPVVGVDGVSRWWQSINSTYGVYRVLINGSQLPYFVPDSKIDEILALSRTEDDPLPMGATVRIRRYPSPWFELIGTVAGMDRLSRVSVMMDIFNRMVEVKFDRADVEVV